MRQEGLAMITKNAKARLQPGSGGDTKQQPHEQHAPAGEPSLPSTSENMKAYRVGFFANDLALLLSSLTGDEIKAMLRFRYEYLFAGASGIIDNDSDLIRRTGWRRWPELKAKLRLLGLLRIVEGILRDDDLEVSVRKQRDAREHGRRAAESRWKGQHDGGFE
jgi:hypothetical protein